MHHFQLFLQYHSQAFLVRFNESPNADGKNKQISDQVVQSCRAFLYQIVDICVGRQDVSLMAMAQDIVVKICLYQF